MSDPPGRGEVVMREYMKGNWSVSETLVLIEAKKMDEERRLRRRSIILPPLQIKQPEIRNRPTPELRWKWIEEYCWRKGCVRSQNQCNDKWDNLMRDYKKIREYESSRVESSFNTGSSPSAAAASSSYWNMEKSERKERNLPSNMLPQIYEALVELVEKKSLPSSSSSSAAAVVNGNGGSCGGQILRHGQQSLGIVAPMMAQPMLQIPATIVLPLPPRPRPPPQYIVLSHPPPPQLPPSAFHAEPIQPTVDTSQAKRRRTTPEETTAGGGRNAEEAVEVGAALSKSASMIAQGIRESEERQEIRHQEVVRLQERILKIEESKAEIDRQNMSGLVDAIDKLGTSIITLVSSCHNNQDHKGGAP